MDRKIICLVAGQRSGTTALRSILAATGRVTNFGEVFHTEETHTKGNFFGYCREHGLMVSDMCTTEQTRKVAEDFIAHLKQLAVDKHVLIDIKFNSWRPLMPAWSYLQEEPFFLVFLKRLRCAFIFIQRMDIAAQIASEAIARTTGKWHNLAGQDFVARNSLDLRMVQKRARLICTSEVFLWNCLKDYGKKLGLRYETMFDNDQLNMSVRTQICELIQEPLRFPEVPAIRKNLVATPDVIENYDEVMRTVEETISSIRRPLL